jgi:hypothetical protein
MRRHDEENKEGITSGLEEAISGISEVEELESQCRLAEDKIREQNEFLNQVLESLTHFFYVLDANDYGAFLEQ